MAAVVYKQIPDVTCVTTLGTTPLCPLDSRTMVFVLGGRNREIAFRELYVARMGSETLPPNSKFYHS